MGFKHPHGELLQVIGDVDRLEHFYEYQLYCKNLVFYTKIYKIYITDVKITNI